MERWESYGGEYVSSLARWPKTSGAGGEQGRYADGDANERTKGQPGLGLAADII